MRGDHLYVIRPLGYTHHGIDAGDGTVIHFTGEPGKKHDASVARTTMADFALDSQVHVREYSRRAPDETVIERAESKLGSREYNLVVNNCEHFATWCCTGRTASQQVRLVSSFTTSGAAVTTAVGTTASVVGAAGTVSGLSGAGIMSGLATAGGYIGGGAAAGPFAIALAPATVSIASVHVALRQDESLPKKENDARRDGRVASIVAAGSASAGGVAAISAAGTAGLSGAGIASGLAAIGGAAGGGMVAGTVLVAAAPAAAAGAAGFGVYLLSKKIRRVTHKKWSPPPPALPPSPGAEARPGSELSTSESSPERPH